MNYDRCQKEHNTASALLGPSLVWMREHMEAGVAAVIMAGIESHPLLYRELCTDVPKSTSM